MARHGEYHDGLSGQIVKAARALTGAVGRAMLAVNSVGRVAT
jgi:hypothetical protein